MGLSKKDIEAAFRNSRTPVNFLMELGRLIREEFSGIQLIGEIEIVEGEETYEILRSSLSSVLGSSLRNKIALFYNTESNAVLALYLVWTGIYRYGKENHELWPHVFNGLGEHDGNIDGECGRLFKRCLRDNELETFDSLDHGRAFITPILLHGLIPARHIKFFTQNFIIQPLNESRTGAYESHHKLVERWVRKCESEPLIPFQSKILLNTVAKFERKLPNGLSRWPLNGTKMFGSHGGNGIFPNT